MSRLGGPTTYTILPPRDVGKGKRRRVRDRVARSQSRAPPKHDERVRVLRHTGSYIDEEQTKCRWCRDVGAGSEPALLQTRSGGRVRASPHLSKEDRAFISNLCAGLSAKVPICV